MDSHDISRKIGEYWDGRAANFDAEHNTEDTAAWKKVLARYLGPDAKASVLDVGAGTGFLANLTAALGFASVGVDVSEAMLKTAVANARALGVPAMYMTGSALELPFMDCTVDHVVNARLIWTLIRPEEAIREWMRVVKPGGSILCFNRFEGEMGRGIRPNFYADKTVDGALKVLGASESDLVALMTAGGLVDVAFERIDAKLTVAGSELEPWYVLRGKKPVS